MEEKDLQRFVEAQNSSWIGYEQALHEIRNGRKVSHWIWYIFPQLEGLGHSYNSHFYGIQDLDEAKRYIQHEVLGPRLQEISHALLSHQGEDIKIIMGGGIDAWKLRSCMTLFDVVCPDSVFKQVLDTFYDGRADMKTLNRLFPKNERD